MKFRILRDYAEFLPQVLHTDSDKPYWVDIGQYRCYTLEEARAVCVNYKRMAEDPIAEEFEL